ncbi:MAG: ROK family transcriptional regulator [Anaerolineales bacterium]|nr:ROK family transcriptional regulator [Anaerolineales bacterium]
MRKQNTYQTGDQALVRQINLSLIMHTLRTDSPISRARLSQKTNLNKTTVSDLINELNERGFVREMGMQTSGTGRPATLLTLNPAAGYIVSCEIGVGFIEVLVTDFGPQTIWQIKQPIKSETAQDEIISQVMTLLHEAVDRGKSAADKLFGIAVGVPGMVDHSSGTILFAPNLKWRNVPLLKLLENESFGAPIFVDNEANMAALGEHYFGAAQGYKEILYLSGNVGLGGGFLSNGQLRRGASGMAAEYGHMTVDTHGELCNCGNYGCWETKVSQNSLYKKVINKVEAGESSILVEKTQGQWERLSVEMIVEAAQAGDKVAIRSLEEIGYSLGIGIASLLNALNPEIVVLGGILSIASEFLFPVVNEEIQKRALLWNRESVKIVRAAHGSDASVKGGTATVYQYILSQATPPLHLLVGS